jgi:hypothetical protein
MTEDQRKKYEDYLEELRFAKTVKEVRALSARIQELLDELERIK